MSENAKESVIKPFKCFPHKSGCSYVLTIPKYNINAGLVNPNKEYEITMTEVSKEKKEDENNES